jgi:predicted enzyme related to lactoylglutathione lyase
MPHVESYRAGTINWVDMVSTDLEAASAFCTGLFGWEPTDMPMPGGEGIYRFFRLGGRDAAAAGTMPPEMAAGKAAAAGCGRPPSTSTAGCSAGTPSRWTTPTAPT